MEKKLKIAQDFKTAFTNYTDCLSKVEARRQLWETETKEIIYNSLTQITKDYKFQWHVQRLEHLTNYQTINISFNNLNSGISEKEYDKAGKLVHAKSYIKHGGYMAYCQSFNGKVNVLIVYPYIEEWVTQKEAKVIATIEPKEISNEKILQHLVQFLNEMSAWEGTDRPPIGYQVGTNN